MPSCGPLVLKIEAAWCAVNASDLFVVTGNELEGDGLLC